MKFIIRFDDVNPNQDWIKFEKIKNELESNDIKSILGVIPECHDESLNIGQVKKNYINYLIYCKDYGDSIAQHGTHHIYTKNNSGLLKINNFSEFAGHDLDYQINLLEKGKKILLSQNLWQPIFMAPGHSFDKNTLSALMKLDFKYVTDGYGIFPYKYSKLIMVPSLFSKPIGFGNGIFTICLHVNSMTDMEVNKIINFIRNNKDKFIDFKDAQNYLKNDFFNKCIINFTIMYVIRFIRLIRGIF